MNDLHVLERGAIALAVRALVRVQEREETSSEKEKDTRMYQDYRVQSEDAGIKTMSAL